MTKAEEVLEIEENIRRMSVCVYVCEKGPGQSHRVKEKMFLSFFDYF